MKLMQLFLAAIIVTTLNNPVIAHTDDMLDKMPSVHGGQTRMAGPYHFELVAGANAVDLYITDHANNAKDASKATVQATLLDGKTLKKLNFSFVKANQLQAKETLSKNEKLQLVVIVTMPNEAPQQAKFTPNKKPSDTHEHKTDVHHDHSHQATDHKHEE